MENLFSKYSSAFTHRSVTKILDVALGPNKVIEPSVLCLSICLQIRVCVRAQIRSKLLTTEHLWVQAGLVNQSMQTPRIWLLESVTAWEVDREHMPCMCLQCLKEVDNDLPLRSSVRNSSWSKTKELGNWISGILEPISCTTNS